MTVPTRAGISWPVGRPSAWYVHGGTCSFPFKIISMERIVQLVLALAQCTAWACWAQPVLHASDHLPVPGSNRALFGADSIPDPLPGGANMVWDFSWLDMQATDTIWYAAPDSMLYFDQVPDAAVTTADTVVEGIPPSTVFYGLDDQGLWRSPIMDHFYCVHPLRFRVLPDELAFLDPVNTSDLGSCWGEWGTFGANGFVEALADGCGTLVMPWGEVPDVLRVAGVDSSTTFGPPPSIPHHYRTVFERYFHAGAAEPVVALEWQSLWVGGAGGWQPAGSSLRYIVDLTLGVRHEQVARVRFRPNPVQEELWLELPPSRTPQRAELFDATGRQYRSWSLPGSQAEHRLDVRTLNSGPYVLVVTDADGHRISSRVVKK